MPLPPSHPPLAPFPHHETHSLCCLTTVLLTAGEQNENCSVHVADAVAVDRLIKTLPNQSQLETLVIAFRSCASYATLSDMDLDEEADMEDEFREDMEMYRRVCDITAQMFHPAWVSVCKLMECGHMFWLRYGTARDIMFALSRSVGSKNNGFAAAGYCVLVWRVFDRLYSQLL